MRFTMGCELAYQVGNAPVPFIFNLEVARTGRQDIRREELSLSPDLSSEAWTAPESGNRYRRVVVQPGAFSLRYEAEVELAVRLDEPGAVGEVPPGELPLATLPDLMASRYCQSDRLARFAWAEFGGLQPGHARVAAICNWINRRILYLRGTTDARTSALDTLGDGAGVCRDFAHLGIALVRALNIPARFASGYALGLVPPDFHATFEAFLRGPDGVGRWYLFDATRQAALDGIVRIGVGRDAAEVSFCTILGGASAGAMRVWMEGAEGDAAGGERTMAAVALED